MNYELMKNEFIKLKKKELEYIDNISKISNNKILTEYYKLEIYRTLRKYELKLEEMFNKIRKELIKNKQLTKSELEDVIIEFGLNKNYLYSLNNYNEHYKDSILEELGIDIETFKFKLTLYDLIYYHQKRMGIDTIDIIQNNQKLIEKPIYIFKCYYDYNEDCHGPCFLYDDDYIYGKYENICSEYSNKKEIPKREIENFEKENVIIYLKEYVQIFEVRKIFEEELLSIKNKTLNDCISETKNRIKKLNYIRSPEYKEKLLLDKINELYKKVKGEFIKEEILYNGDFLCILKEIYKLPNKKLIQKEKIIKNGGKNSVIVIGITQDKEYIITFQNRIRDKIIAEFPSGYIENDEGEIEAAKRELKEETGYITDNLFIVDKVYTSPGIDNSVTYIVIANNCIKKYEKNNNGTELVNYGLFSEMELNYLISKNIMNSAINKLAYYNLINNVDSCNIEGIKKFIK